MLSNETSKIIKRLQMARLSLMKKQPFYAVLLLNVQFSIDPMCETAYTDGKRIAFGPDFLEEISDRELEFVMMHEVLHIALNHCYRTKEDYDFELFNIACDIVVNSNILYSSGFNLNVITLKKYGESMHETPSGQEGYLFTAEQVYEMLKAGFTIPADGGSGKNNKGSQNGTGGKKKKEDDTEDPDEDDDGAGNSGKSDKKKKNDGKNSKKKDDASDNGKGSMSGFDDHTYWNISKQGESDGVEKEMEQYWLQKMIEATEIAVHIDEKRAKKGQKGCGSIPLLAERIIKELTKPQTNWREILQNFVQDEINDYSFNPPDRRLQDCPFILPDYNEKDEDPKNIWFCIDTSGSISDKELTAAYSEIVGAIEQFEGHLSGWLSLFDHQITEPEPFENVDDVLTIRPVGGGGTSFHIIFQKLEEIQDDLKVECLVIITDGYAPFPGEDASLGIPVLWLINNDKVDPPWGKVARIKIEE